VHKIQEYTYPIIKATGFLALNSLRLFFEEIPDEYTIKGKSSFFAGPAKGKALILAESEKGKVYADFVSFQHFSKDKDKDNVKLVNGGLSFIFTEHQLILQKVNIGWYFSYASLIMFSLLLLVCLYFYRSYRTYVRQLHELVTQDIPL